MSVRTREQLGPDASEEDIFELADRCLEGRRYRRPKPETPAERLERGRCLEACHGRPAGAHVVCEWGGVSSSAPARGETATDAVREAETPPRGQSPGRRGG